MRLNPCARVRLHWPHEHGFQAAAPMAQRSRLTPRPSPSFRSAQLYSMGGRLAITLAVGLPLWPAALAARRPASAACPSCTVGRLAGGTGSFPRPEQLRTMPAQRVSASRVPASRVTKTCRPLEGGRHPHSTRKHRMAPILTNDLDTVGEVCGTPLKAYIPVPLGINSIGREPSGFHFTSDFANGIRPLFRSLLRQERLHGDNAPPQ